MKDEMTATLRIPTKQQYAYLEFQMKGKPEDIIKQYLALTALYLKLQDEATKATVVPF
jgi:hypothetical protein